MKITMSHILHGPHTRSGKWSVGLIVAMPLLFLLGDLSMKGLYPSVPGGDTLLEDIAARPALALSMLGGMVTGVIAFVTGFVAVFREKERSLFVYLSTAVGALLLLFLLGEFISPH